MKYKIEIPHKFPSFNEYVQACRYNKFAGAKMKRQVQDDIGYFIKQLPKINKPVKAKFTWIEENQKRDLDNICYAKKFILDSLVELGVLKNDNRKMVCGFTDEFKYDKECKVILELEETDENTQSDN